ncbi:MAG: hypothetical protein ACRDBP_03180, partial [Luteolibacter sp.]
MVNEHPFQVLFETLARVPMAHAESVNRQAYDILSDLLAVPVEKSGRCILLRAPRAGHGKTHLLSRIQHQLGASHEFVPLQAGFGCRIDAASVTDDTLRRLVRQLPASGGLTALDLVSRRLFASALQPLVASGEVPCQDREGAITALRNRPIETFDFHHPNAVTAHWARENFEVLGQRLSMELANRVNLSVGAVSFWVNALFHFAAAPLESSNRVRVLAEAAHGEGGVGMERLEALLGLLTLQMRVVLVADDLEGFSTDETAALRLAAFLGSLRHSVERLDVILSLNRDIWESAFMPRLSGGLADRLSEIVVELEPLTESEMEALLESRVPGLGRRVLDHVDLSSSGTHARGLIRAAGTAWLKASGAAIATAPPAAAVSVVAPAAFTAVAPVPPAGIEEIAPIVEVDPAVAEPVGEVASSTASEAEAAELELEALAPVFAEQAAAGVPPETVFWQSPVEESLPPVAAQVEVPPSAPAEPLQGFENSWNSVPPVFPPQPEPVYEAASSQFATDPAPPFSGSSGWQDFSPPPPPVAPLEEFLVPVRDQAASTFAPPHWIPEPADAPAPSWQQSSPPPQQGIFDSPPDYRTVPEPSS